MSLISEIYLDADSLSLGSPDAAVFNPDAFSDPGNAELTAHSQNDADFSFVKNDDGDYTATVPDSGSSPFSGAVYSSLTVTL